MRDIASFVEKLSKNQLKTSEVTQWELNAISF